jgi:hypothetical protein
MQNKTPTRKIHKIDEPRSYQLMSPTVSDGCGNGKYSLAYTADSHEPVLIHQDLNGAKTFYVIDTTNLN